jgi:hypothetical protein
MEASVTGYILTIDLTFTEKNCHARKAYGGFGGAPGDYS